MTTITNAAVINAVKEVLTERGSDFVYKPAPNPNYNPASDNYFDTIANVCLYSTDGGATGSCAVGTALIEKLGVTYDPAWEGKPAHAVLEDVAPDLDNRVANIIDSVQGDQDSGGPYGTVLEYFEECLEASGIES